MIKRNLVFSLGVPAVLTAALVTVAGCRSNPYPDEGQLLNKKPEKQSLPYSIEAPDVVEFQEGSEGLFAVSGHVPSGQVQITFEGLPAGAQYNASNGQVVWTPDFDAANDPNNPAVIEKIYSVTVTVKDAADSVAVVQKTVTLLVHDVPRSFDLQGLSPTAQLTEGQPYALDFQIRDSDFPQGPFAIQATGLPMGAQFTQDRSRANVVHLSFTPDFGFVRSTDYGSKTVDWSAIILDPRGHKVTAQVRWTVSGNRQNPLVYIPKDINQGPPAVTFMLNTIDPNGESIPQVTIDSPDVGVIATEDAGSAAGTPTSKPFQLINVKWTGIPVTERGKRKTLTVNSCVMGASGSWDQCSVTTVPVYLNGGAP